MSLEPLGGLDSAFLALDELVPGATPMQMGLVLVLEAPEGDWGEPVSRLGAIRRVVAERHHLVARLHQRPVGLGGGIFRPLWVDDPAFRVDDHVHQVAVPPPGGEPELWETVAELISRPLASERPLWELVVVEGLADGRTAVLVKAHHALLDGISGATAVGAFLDALPGPPQPPPTVEPWAPAPPPGPWELARHAVTLLAAEPAEAVETLVRGAGALAAVGARRLLHGRLGEPSPPLPFAAPRTSCNGPTSPTRTLAVLVASQADVAAVGHAFGATVNDVTLAVVGGGLRRFLAERGEQPGQALTALVPVSTRDRGDPRPFGNRLSAMLVSLATDRDDPVERLHAVAASARSAKEQERLAGGDLLERLAGLAPPWLVAVGARCAADVGAFERLPPPWNVSVSGLRGPDVDLWCGGGRVVGVVPLGPVATPIGLNVTVMSYGGSHHFGFLGCRRLVPDIDRLAGAVERELRELVDAVGQPAPPPDGWD